MAYVAPVTRTTGALITAAIWNQDVVANVAYFKAGPAIDGLLDLSGAAAGQIQFPATPNPSANANTFDDYKKGSWTPTLKGLTTAGTQTYSIRVGTFTKKGREIAAHADIVLSAFDPATAGSMQLGGLPEAAAASPALFMATPAYFSGVLTSWIYISGYAVGGTTNMNLLGAKVASTTPIALAPTDIGGTFTLRLTVVYHV
jgi:hypothetical protein